MRSDHNDNASVSEGALLVMLAEINNHMMTIRDKLASNPAVVAATRSCDIRRYQGSMRDEAVHNFESYVEAKTDKGEIFCWSLYITLMPHGWRFERNIARQTSDGEQQEKDFEDFTFDRFSELANHYMALMTDFHQSTNNFDFDSR
jgi:hypothetical protein